MIISVLLLIACVQVAAAKLAPLRDAALTALCALALQSERVRESLRPIDGVAVCVEGEVCCELLFDSFVILISI